jgi:hypothetical protein
VKCLSIRQPWPWLILRPDLSDSARAEAATRGEIKDIENRTWPTRFRGRVLIHASKGMTRDEYEDAVVTTHYAGLEIALPPMAELQRGGIVGVVSIVDCIPGERRTSPWHMGGQFGFQLANPRPLPFIPCRGALQLFDAPPDVCATIRDLYNSLHPADESAEVALK